MPTGDATWVLHLGVKESPFGIIHSKFSAKPLLRGTNENMLSNSARRIGNQLCFADLRPTKRLGRSTDNPEDPEPGLAEAIMQTPTRVQHWMLAARAVVRLKVPHLVQAAT